MLVCWTDTNLNINLIDQYYAGLLNWNKNWTWILLTSIMLVCWIDTNQNFNLIDQYYAGLLNWYKSEL